MTQYLLSVHTVAGQPERSPEAARKAYQDTAVLNAELQAEGSWSPSPTFEVKPQLGGNAEGPRPVRFVFTARGSAKESSS